MDSAALPVHGVSQPTSRVKPIANPTWRWLPVLLMLISIAARLPQVWSTHPLDVDEALYATFSREISHFNNSMLLNQPVDKPPLAFYVTAFSFKWFGTPSDWAARLPSFFASCISLAVLWRLSRALYPQTPTAAPIAVLIVALSPLDAMLAGSVFTDPQMIMWVLLACLLAFQQRWTGAAVSAGLAFMTKQSAVQFIPMIIALGLIRARHRRTSSFCAATGSLPSCL